MAIKRSDQRIYVPDVGITLAQPEVIPRVMYEELTRIANVLRVVQLGRLEAIFVTPSKPNEGDIRLALAPLDLGSGDGVYCYYGGAWNKLG